MRESPAGSVCSGPGPSGLGLPLSQLRTWVPEAIAAMPLHGAGQEAGGPLGTLCAVSSSWGLAGTAFYTGRLGYFGAVSPSRGWEQQTHSISFPPITVTTLVCPGVGWTNGQRGWYFWPVLFLLEVEVGWPNLPSLPGAVPVLKVEVPHPRPPSLFTLEQWFRGNFHPQGH